MYVQVHTQAFIVRFDAKNIISIMFINQVLTDFHVIIFLLILTKCLQIDQ